MRVQLLSSKSILPLRQAVLRPGRRLSECVFDDDEHPETFHLGALEKETLLGIVSLMRRKNLFFKEKHQFQLRGMAVLPEFRNRNIGTKLLNAAEEKLRSQNAQILWCNAREPAIGFYEKNGFTTIGESFNIPEVGPHRLMFKKL